MRKRKFKILLYVTGILLSFPVMYILIGCPAVTAEMGFRRAERAHLVGPSLILGTEEIHTTKDGWLMIARSEDGFTLYPYTLDSNGSENLYYFRKTDDITVASVYDDYVTGIEDPSLPIIVFDDYSEAVRAELELSYSIYYNNMYYENSYYLQSDRTTRGYFVFSLPFASNMRIVSGDVFIRNVDADKENSLIYAISGMLSGEFPHDGVPITVRLYNQNDNLIAEKNLLVGSTGQY